MFQEVTPASEKSMLQIGISTICNSVPAAVRHFTCTISLLFMTTPEEGITICFIDEGMGFSKVKELSYVVYS